MTLDVQIEKERETLDGLRREIERLKGEGLADLKKFLPHARLLQELQRQEKEHAERLASLIQQQTAAPERLPGAPVTWYETDPDTLRRRQIVLKNPKMPSKNLCAVFDGAIPPIPLPRDWRADLSVDTWSKAYENRTGRNRIQKIVSTDRRAGRASSS
jgi:hypothetical protein